MQSVLSIDTSISPPLAAVVQFNEGNIVVQELHQLANEDTANDKPFEELLSRLLTGIKSSWTSSVLLLPPKDYLSLNVNLPFTSSKSLDKIIDLEVQDCVPFDTNEFLLHPRALQELPSKERDVHIAMMPKGVVAQVISSCKKCGLEPEIVSNPASALAAALSLSKSFCSHTALFILPRADYFAIALSLEGEIICDRFIARNAAGKNLDADIPALQEIRLTLTAWENRYQKSIQHAYLIADNLPPLPYSDILGFSITNLSPKNLVTSGDESTIVAALASTFVADEFAPIALTNFRTREYSYSPQLTEILKGLKSIAPFFLTTLTVIAIATGFTYLSRERRISKIKQTVSSEIRKAVPYLSFAAGQEIDALEGENRRLDQQLSSLGSLSALSPLDYLLEVSNDLPLATGISVSRIKIDGNKMKVDGTAPDYAAMEKLEKYLKRKKNIYCKIRKDTTASSPSKPNSRGFTLDITLCE